MGMTLNDATTPMEPLGGRQHQYQKQSVHGATASPAATLGATGTAQGRADTCEAPSRLHAASSTHGPFAPSINTTSSAAGGDAEEGMLLGRVPATPLSTNWRGPIDTMASTPEYSMGVGAALGDSASEGASLGGQVRGAFSGQQLHGGRGEPCITPQGNGSGGGSDMEADTPGIRPTPVRTRVGVTPPSLFAANSAAALSPPMNLQPQNQQPQSQQPQRQQQAGAGCSGRGGGCGLHGNLDVTACRADWLYHR
eukprot:1156845-Pelagomonas_calceolata.AAC.2